MPGPVGKRSSALRRRNKDVVETIRVNLEEALAEEVEIPAPPMRYEVKDPETGEIEELEEPEHIWHPTAVAWYMSLTKSGQALFYEPSDWQTAYMLAEQISLALEPRPVQIGSDDDGKPIFRYMRMPMVGAFLTAVLKGSSSLMTTEGERRRLKIELDRKAQREAQLGGDGKVVSIAKTREDVFKREARG